MGRKKSISDRDLLDVARTVFVESGFGAATKEIARRAGVSEGVIYQRFNTKDELFFAAMIPPPSDVTELFRSCRLQGRDLVEQLTLSMLEFSRQALPVLLPLMMHPGFRLEDLAARHPESPLFVLRREIGPFLKRESDAGRLAQVDARGASLLIWSLAQAIALFEKLGAHGGHFDPEIIRSTIECIWQGLAPRPPAAPRNPRRGAPATSE